MALYSNDAPGATFSGQYLAHARLTPQQRAEIAAGLTDGSVSVRPLTVAQATTLTRARPVDVTNARRANGNGRPDGETLGQRIIRASPTERLEAAREVARALGENAMWDQMVAPLIGVDRA